MKRSTIILVVLALIATAVLYYWWRKAEAPAPGPAPALISLLPADASYVFYADAAALRASPFVQELLVRFGGLPSPKEAETNLANAKEDRDYAEFVRRSGFDYTRDLDRIAVAIGPKEAETNLANANVKGSKGRNDKAVYAIAEGRFDRAKIAAYAAESGQRADRGAHEAYLIPAQNGGKVLLVFLDEDLPAATSGKAGRILLTDDPAGASGHDQGNAVRAYGHTPVQASPSPLDDRIARVAASELFAVGHVSPLPTNFLPPGVVSGELKKTLESIQWITLAARLAASGSHEAGGVRAYGDTPVQASSVQVVLEAECASAADAKKLAWSLEGLRVLARMALSDPKSTKGMDPALATLFHTILKDGKITSAERYTRLAFSLGPDFLATLQPHPPAPPKKAAR